MTQVSTLRVNKMTCDFLQKMTMFTLPTSLETKKLFFLLSFFVTFVGACNNGTHNSVLLELDKHTRDAFNSSQIRSGLYLVDEENAHVPTNSSIRILNTTICNISEGNDTMLLPASTGWKFSRIFLKGHHGELQIYSAFIEMSYIFTNSTGLMSASTSLFRRGNMFSRLIPHEFNFGNQAWEFPVRVVMRKTGNGTFGFSLPGHDISNVLALGNDSYGRLTTDCSLDRKYQDFKMSGFTAAKREECLGLVGPVGYDTQCWFANSVCHAKKCKDRCCPSENQYNRNATCAWISIPVKNMGNNITFMDLLQNSSSWSFDPPLGTGNEFQKVFIQTKSQQTKSSDNAEVEKEARQQLRRRSDVSESLLSRMVISAENSIAPKSNEVELALVCSAVFSTLLAIDSVRVYIACLALFKLLLADPMKSKLADIISVLLALVISIFPAFMVSGVLVFQEITRGRLKMIQIISGWHASVVWDAPGAEKIWWVRRVVAEVEVSTTHGIRFLYIFLPLILLVLDFVVELYCIIRHRSILKSRVSFWKEERDVLATFSNKYDE